MPFQSKFRHVYGESPKQETWYRELGGLYTSGEGGYVAANSEYFGVSKSGGGGPVIVHPVNKAGQRGAFYTVNVHKGKALDFSFSPFFSNILGIASEDCSVSITQFPKLLDKKVTAPSVEMKGHTKKVHLLKFAPSVNNIMATASWDKTVKIWNVTNGETVINYQSLGAPCFSMEWKNDSSLLAATTKDKKLTIFDPRQEAPAAVITEDDGNFFPGSKSSKCFWAESLNWIGSTGYSRDAKRGLKLYDMKKLGTPIFQSQIDTQSSILMPTYDDDLNMLWLWGKGDASVSYYELTKTGKFFNALGSYRDVTPQKGGCFSPKLGLDTKKCEVMRFYKLTQKNLIPISFRVPRKTGADIFQEDIYPDCDSQLPALKEEEWMAGKSDKNATTSMNPANRTDVAEEKEDSGFVAKKPYGELVTENAELKVRIAELEKQLAELGSS